ncbi:uncharacterized protein si:ch211-1a19.3 [Syngnathus scovelli]|uniref:uncharacterized protein si:ch211-1a19.3 n=1 Tax=Syngnathus scovelli TaxID=161590 RepID=UPI00210F4E81|nr:uncharacterized protein si:ch211-1a19.3 [Syngnathus scovelli]
MTAAATSKSGKTGSGTKAALVVLALWSVISLVVIVVWSTSPDLKSSARCRQDLRESQEKILGAEVLCVQDKDELEQRLAEAHQRLRHQEAALALLDQRLRHANQTLDACYTREAVLMANMSVVREGAELLQRAQLNLTNQLQRQEDHAEAMQHNLTQSDHLVAVCSNLKAAADNHAAAAHIQTRACEAKQEFLRKQLVKCQKVAAEASPPPQQNPAPPESRSSRLCTAPTIVALVFGSRLLVN